jgi:hypothetical protein
MVALLICAEITHGAATEQVGPTSAQGRAHGLPTPTPPDSVTGILRLSWHESRVYSVWVNGNENFYFNASPSEINELIRLFSEERMRDHMLYLRVGTPSVQSFKGNTIPYNVNLHSLEGMALGHYQENGGPETYEPTLTVYVNPTDSAFLGQMELPDNIILDSPIVYHPVKGKSTKPDRKVWYAEMQFNDSTPAVDFQHLIFTTVTFWEKGDERGVKLGSVNHEGYFKAAFSEREIADLKADKSWLTLTVGNLQTEAQRDHLRLSVNSLTLDKHQAEPIKINKPKFYYGRILFEDGSAPSLDPVLWQGAKIHVLFSNVGSVFIDSKGYFGAYLTKEQYEQLKRTKAARIICIPKYEDKSSGTAQFTFPVSELSLTKEEAGVVRIPRPGPRKQAESK